MHYIEIHLHTCSAYYLYSKKIIPITGSVKLNGTHITINIYNNKNIVYSKLVKMPLKIRLCFRDVCTIRSFLRLFIRYFKDVLYEEHHLIETHFAA